MSARSYGQYCGVVTALEQVGERWALLIVRNLLVGPRRYSDLKLGLPRIPTNILSVRLKELQETGVIRRVALPYCGLVYELTDYGRQLEPVVLALCRWGGQALREPEPGDGITADSWTVALRAAFRGDAVRDLPQWKSLLRCDDLVWLITVDGAQLSIATPAAQPAAEWELAVQPVFQRYLFGTASFADAVELGWIRLAAGSTEGLAQFAARFGGR